MAWKEEHIKIECLCKQLHLMLDDLQLKEKRVFRKQLREIESSYIISTDITINTLNSMKQELHYKLIAQWLFYHQKLSTEETIKKDLKTIQFIPTLPLKLKSKGEDWTIILSWFIPRKYRKDIVGDIFEDCIEMRNAGCTERIIKFHVVYQWIFAVVTLVPTVIKSSIVEIIRKVISTQK